MYLKNLNTPEKVMTFMERISYGWMGIDGNIRKNTIKGLQKLYRTQSAEELINSKHGICIDEVELERTLLSNNYGTKSFAIITPNMFHAFLLLEKDGIITYFEHSSYSNRGIYQFLSEEEALEFVLNNFIKNHRIRNRKKMSLVEYPPIPPETTFQKLKEILKNSPNALDSNKKDMKTY